MTASRHNLPWERDELVLALYLYCQIPFSRTKASNLQVIQLAKILGRTPSSVARKLGNFGAFDPLLTQKGIVGLVHYSKSDRKVWETFHQNWDLLVLESQKLLKQYDSENGLSFEDEALLPTSRETERQATMTVRLGQDFFRRTVLSSYRYSCCMCGIDLPELLVGSHIIPWSNNKETRMDPQNGLCLCSVHDRAFDRGLISVDENMKIRVSSKTNKSRSSFTAKVIKDFEGKEIRSPQRFAPKIEYLKWHWNNLFQK